MMKRYLLILLASVVVGALVLAGCNSAANTTKPAAKTSSQAATTGKLATTAVQPKAGGTLKMGDVSAPPGSIGWPSDPLFLMSTLVINIMFEPLVTVDLAGTMQPKLATKWEITSDLKSITLTLRQGVKFHDGSDFNAEVAKWNIDQMIAAHVMSMAAFVSSDVIDNYTLRINFKSYNNTVPNGLSQTFMSSKAAFDKNGLDWMKNNPVGTGPFKLTNYQPNVSLKTVKFADYWQKGKPYLDGIEMKFIGDAMTRAAAFEAGEIDIASSDPSKTEADLVKKGYPIVSASPGIFCMVPDTKNSNSPLSNLKVRQAVDYAIDRASLVKNLGYGFWGAVYQYSLPGTASYINSLQGRTFNLDKAKQLISEAGYTSSAKISLFGSQMAGEDVITAIQGYLAKAGITAEVSMADSATYGNYQMKGWTNGFVCGAFSTERNLNISLNFIWTRNSPFVAGMQKTDELDKIYADASTTKDLDPALIQKATQYIYDTAMFLPIYTTTRASIMKSYVHDTGLYTQAWFNGWEPASAWLDK